MKHRTLALAGMMQGRRLVQSIARSGQADEADLTASLASVKTAKPRCSRSWSSPFATA